MGVFTSKRVADLEATFERKPKKIRMESAVNGITWPEPDTTDDVLTKFSFYFIRKWRECSRDSIEVGRNWEAISKEKEDEGGNEKKKLQSGAT